MTYVGDVQSCPGNHGFRKGTKYTKLICSMSRPSKWHKQHESRTPEAKQVSLQNRPNIRRPSEEVRWGEPDSTWHSLQVLHRCTTEPDCKEPVVERTYQGQACVQHTRHRGSHTRGGQWGEHEARGVPGELVVAAVQREVHRDRPRARRQRVKDLPQGLQPSPHSTSSGLLHAAV